jgi:hypothetical protein
MLDNLVWWANALKVARDLDAAERDTIHGKAA